MAARARQRRWVLGGLAVGAFVLVLATDTSGIAGSSLNLAHLARSFALVGLLTLGQQLLRRVGVVDLGTGAVMALSATLAVGLASDAGPWTALAAGLVVALMVGLAVAAVLRASEAPAPLVTLLPLLVAPAALPETAFGATPPLLSDFAYGTPGGLPWLLWLYLLLLAATAVVFGPRCRGLRARVAGDLRLIAACGGVGLLWGLAGVWWAGLEGGPSEVPLWPAALGLGAALLAEPWLTARLELGSGLAAAALLAVGLNAVDLRAGAMGLGFEPRARGVLAALVLLAGLYGARRRPSAHAEQLGGDDVDVAAGRDGNNQLEPAPFAGGDGV